MITTFPLSRRAAWNVFALNPNNITSRARTFGVSIRSSRISSCWLPPKYFLFQNKNAWSNHDCKWMCSTPFAFRGDYTPSSRNAQRTASIAINQKIIELGQLNDWKGILELFFKQGESFNNVNYATAMAHFGRIRFLETSDPGFVAFLNLLLENMERRGLSWIEVRPAGTIIYTIGKMKLINASTQRILGWITRGDIANQFVEEAIRTGNPQSIANTVWALARLQMEAPPLLSAVEARTDWLVQNCTPQGVANIVWAFATLKTEAPNLLSAIEERSNWLVQNGKTQEVANTVWAFAVLQTRAPKLLAAIADRSSWLAQNGSPRDVANTVWALASLNTPLPKFLAEIDARADWLVRCGNTQEVANTVWAFATLQIAAPKLLAAIEDRSTWLVQNGNAQDMANTAWAFATLKTPAPSILAAIEEQSHGLVENANAQEVANTAWALATLKTDAPKLLAALDKRADLLVHHGTAQNIANCAWAFASIGFEATHFFNVLDWNPATVLGKECNMQCVANLCFAISIGGRVVASESLLLPLWDRAIQLYEADSILKDEQCWQLTQTQIFARAWGVGLSPCPATMTRRMEEAMATKSVNDNLVSRASKEVSKILSDIGFDHECEVPPDGNIVGGMMAIDFACTRRKVAIEYDGEWHFLRALGSGELTSKQDGSTKAKSRLLKQLGWTVINLDFREYITACDRSKETEWLRKELNDAGVVLP